MKKPILILLSLIVFVTVFTMIVSQKKSADLIIINASIYTVDAELPTAEAVAVRGSRIIAVGTTQDIQNHYTSQNVIDAKGKTIIPGLTDSHAHVLGLGKSLTELNLYGTESAQQIAAMVAEKVKHSAPGEWIRGRGWDQNDWGTGTGAKPFPSAAILDKVAPHNPVILSRIDGHAIWVNSKAMEIASRMVNLRSDVEGGRILRDRSGAPTGIFIDNAEAMITSAVPAYTASEKLLMYRRAFDLCAKYGITSVHDMGVDKDDVELYRALAAEKKLPVRIYALIGGAGPLLDSMFAAGPYVDPGKYFSLRGIKLYLDGALGSRGAALNEPYSDEPEHRGLITMSPDSIRLITEKALRTGFQVCVHAIGDRAVNIALNEFEHAMKTLPEKSAGARMRIEHAQIIAPEDFGRFKQLNVIPSMQPSHATSDMYWAQSRIGPERILGAYAWRSLLDDGNIIASGSDFPVELPNPLLGFYAAVTRQDGNGIPGGAEDIKKHFQLSAEGLKDPSHFSGGWYADQCMTRLEALKSYTIWGAEAEFMEHEKGSIREGKLADIVILSHDIMSVPVKEIIATEVEMTIVGGIIRYQKTTASTLNPVVRYD